MKLRNYTFLALATTLLLSSCSKGGNEVNNPLSINEQSVVAEQATGSMNIVLDADVQLDEDVPAEVRNLNYKVGAKGTERDDLEEKNLHSLCIIANETGTTKYYVNLEWKKTPGTKHFYVKQLDVKQLELDETGKPKSIPNLDTTQKWYIKGFLTYNKANLNLDPNAPSIRYAPNGTSAINLKALTQGGPERQAMDIPLYFDWTPLTVETNLKGSDAVATSTEQSRPKEKQIQIKPFGTMLRISVANKEDYDVRLKSLRLVSNVATPNAGTLKLAECSAPNVAVQALPYVPNAMSDDYNLSLQDAPYKLTAGASHNKSYILWLLPKPAAQMPAKKSTHLLANVVRLDGNTEVTYPKMSTLYVWGSKGNNPQHRKRVHVTANIYRPKLAIEYFSDGYVKKTNNERGTPYNDFVRGTNGAAVHSYAFWTGANKVPTGYRMLTRADKNLLHQNDPNYKFGGGKKTITQDLTINGVEVNYTELYDAPNKTEVIYGLRFDDGDGKRRQYTAWRYYRDGLMQVVYLGPNFRGDLEDIKQDAFWSLHAADIVDRQYGKSESSINTDDATAKANSMLRGDGYVTFLHKEDPENDYVGVMSLTHWVEKTSLTGYTTRKPNPPVLSAYNASSAAKLSGASLRPGYGWTTGSTQVHRESTLFVIQTEIDKKVSNTFKPTFNK